MFVVSYKHTTSALYISQQSNVLGQFHRSLLPRIKVNRNFPLALIHINPALGGLGLKTLDLEQGLRSISQLIYLWDSVNPDSNLLRVRLEFMQLEVGSARLALNASFSLHGYLDTTGWLESV